MENTSPKNRTFWLHSTIIFYGQYLFQKFFLNLLEIRSPRLQSYLLHSAYFLSKFFPSLKWHRFATYCVLSTRLGVFHIREQSFDAICASPDYERPDLNFTLTLLKREQAASRSVLYLDVGANIGAYSIKLGRQFYNWDGLRITALEPNPESFLLLQKNIRENGLERKVTAQNVGLLDHPGPAVLTLNKIDPGSSSLRTNIHKQDPAVTVELLTVDDILSAWPSETLPETIFMKLDVEGTERAVLQGAKRLLNSGATLLLMVEDCVDPAICDYLHARGFCRLAKHTPYNSFWTNITAR